MTLTRRAAWFLTLAGVFQWAVWPNFLRNIWQDERSFGPGPDGGPTSFLVVHAVLTVASLALGSGVLALGVRALRAR